MSYSAQWPPLSETEELNCSVAPPERQRSIGVIQPQLVEEFDEAIFDLPPAFALALCRKAGRVGLDLEPWHNWLPQAERYLPAQLERVSNQAIVLKHFHFPCDIFRLSFVIAGTMRGLQ
jgi:hypothetical protein